MSYVAIARKWRPGNFDDIAGQVHVTRTLQNAIRLDRVHHAFLFTGARGVGKTTAARVLARALNCDQGPTPDPCGTCASCLEIAQGFSPDVIEIDGASNNSVDDVRELRESVRYLPQRGRRKVYIVDEVHMLSKGAFNALLKTLEEPPAHVVFIFATTEPQKIPDTILSRVQRFDFKRIPANVVVERLKGICDAEGVEVPIDGLRLVARAGEGSMRDAESLLDRVINFAGTKATVEQVADVLGLVDRKLLYNMLEGMLRGQADQCLGAIDQVYGYGYDLSEFTAEMLELLRNATLVGLSPSSQRYLDVPDDERTRLVALAEGVPPEVFVRSFQVMIDVHDQVSRAARPRLVLEMAVAQLVTIRPARPLDQIVERIGDIERRLRHGGVLARPRDAARREPRGSQEDDSESDPPGPAPALPDDPGPDDPGPDGPGLGNPGPGDPGPGDPGPGGRGREPTAERMDSGFQRSDSEPAAPTPPAPRLAADEVLSLDEEDAAADLPAVPTGADTAARFAALQVWLDGKETRFDAWARDAVLLDLRPPVLEVGFPNEMLTRFGRNTAAEPRLLDALTACFPTCTRVEVTLRRPGVGGFSRREQMAAARQARIDGLRRDLTDEALVVRARGLLGADLVAVHLPDEPPVAPEKSR